MYPFRIIHQRGGQLCPLQLIFEGGQKTLLPGEDWEGSLSADESLALRIEAPDPETEEGARRRAQRDQVRAWLGGNNPYAPPRKAIEKILERDAERSSGAES